MPSVLTRLLSRQKVARLAGDPAFQRGRAYRDGGQVRSLVVLGDTLTATVIGTEEYAVRLWTEDGELQHQCSCPIGADGQFCKHCVATALAWHEAGTESGAADGEEDRTPLVRLDDLRPWLLEQPASTLAGYLLEAAERDDRLREKLLRAAARATARGIDLPAYRRSLDRATRTGGFIDYYGAGGYAEGVRDAVEPIREMLADTPGQAPAIVGLVEHALRRVETALESADDSNGEIGTLLGELQELHLAACRAAKPDPEELARRLFAWELDDHWDVFYNAAETYAGLLGETGLATYRRLAEAAWDKLPALRPGDREDYASNRFRLTGIMEALARTSGDVDALAAIKAKNLTSPYRYLEIAGLYRDAGRNAEALDWAERGATAFPGNNYDSRLLEFLADEYHRRQRHPEALALIWRWWEDRPSLETYRRLKHHADRSGDWPAWRERALALLRRKHAEASARTPRRPVSPWERAADRSTLAEIFLWEEDAETAWTEAQAGGCSRGLWLQLAKTRQKDHPADAIPIYLREAEAHIALKNNQAYEEAVGHLGTVKSLQLSLGLADEWNACLARLRAAHKPKRNFIALAARL